MVLILSFWGKENLFSLKIYCVPNTEKDMKNLNLSVIRYLLYNQTPRFKERKYSRPPLPMEDASQPLQWLPEPVGSTEPCTC